MPGRVYLAKLRRAGLGAARILGKTGCATSDYTEGYHILARKPRG